MIQVVKGFVLDTSLNMNKKRSCTDASYFAGVINFVSGTCKIGTVQSYRSFLPKFFLKWSKAG